MLLKSSRNASIFNIKIKLLNDQLTLNGEVAGADARHVNASRKLRNIYALAAVDAGLQHLNAFQIENFKRGFSLRQAGYRNLTMCRVGPQLHGSLLLLSNVGVKYHPIDL